MSKKEKIKEIFKTLKSGIRVCEMLETKNCNGDVIGYRQGLSLSYDCFGRYIYCRDSGQWTVRATLENLADQLKSCNLGMIVTEREFEKKSGKSFLSVQL